MEGVIALINGDVGAFADSIKNLLTTLANSLFGIGKDMFTQLWNGLKSIWTSIGNWVSEKTSWLKDKLTFWKSGSAEIGRDGSHASGLPVVPYDGYVAELHRGESIMSAGAVTELTDAIKKLGSTQQSGPSQPINVQLTLDGKTLAQLLVDPIKQASRFNGNNYITMGGSAI